MKKKIVYISGAEVFDVNDVRAAFDEVRIALKLDKDTILFGVPVDESEQLGVAESAPIVTDEVDEAENDVMDESDVVIEEVEDEEPVDNDDAKEDEPAEDEETQEENPAEDVFVTGPQDEDTAPEETVDMTNDESDSEDAPVVPILSVLAAKTETVATPAPDADDTDAPVATSDDDNKDILDGIDDDMPTASEKTLEELLETMTPLREDADVPRPKKKKSKEVKQEPVAAEIDEIDATLENLASEFAENQDKVATPKKSSERGKIGKLKNILPFKKMKRDDSGLMGDLFGWAGIAANDDDFTTPGFFK